jgi:hypothetical protein
MSASEFQKHPPAGETVSSKDEKRRGLSSFARGLIIGIPLIVEGALIFATLKGHHETAGPALFGLPVIAVCMSLGAPETA